MAASPDKLRLSVAEHSPEWTVTTTEQAIQEAKYAGATRLDLRAHGLAALPECLSQLKDVQEIDISGNRMRSLPGCLGELTQLRVLNVSNNELRALPEWLGGLTNLRLLDVSQNQIEELPESLGQLSQLQSLMIWDNQLTGLSESLGQLRKLQRLDASKNALSELPESLRHLGELQVLAAWGNRLAVLPESLGRLGRLQSMDVSNNRLRSLPESLGQLADLEFLIVWGNRLTALPESLGRLTKLRKLDASNNQLSHLPDCWDRLSQLQFLILWGNHLTALPASLRTLRSLTDLLLHQNDGLGLPGELLGPAWHEIGRGAIPASPAKILDYYFSLRGGEWPLNEAKLILVGRGGAGKTSLVNRLTDNRFDRYERRTEGISITGWKLCLNSGEEVRLNIWDFGGQEILHATHQFFLTQRSVYLLVLEGRGGAEDADAEYWLNFIESFGPDCPVIVVLNKIKEFPFDLNRRGLQQKHPAIRDYVTTDCEDATGIDQLRRTIARETDCLQHLRDRFPAAWSAIKERLSSMEENYLTFEQYRQICAEKGEKDAASQESLAFSLHCLGIALNYKDDPRLRDTHILNPRWVTNGIYRILSFTKLQQQKGILCVADLSEILPSQDYPRRMHVFLLDLMKRFDLCFSFPDDSQRYLIPELLDKQQPTVTDQFSPGECLSFQYHYSVLAEGLLPRFVVRTHVLSASSPRWRTGVVLQFEGNPALVKADVHDKKVSISVAGPSPGRRRLLAIIRSDFERIHADFPKLRAQAMVPVPGCPDVVVSYEELLVMEENGVKTFPKVVDGKIVELDVEELLTGVDLGRTRGRKTSTKGTAQGLRLFYCYSHKDEQLRNELATHLKLLERRDIIAPWHDRMIEGGEDWTRSIEENLERADVVLLLVSPDFISSDYCYEKEMQRALQRHEAGETRVIPVILRDVNWGHAPFARLQALPKDGLAVAKWPDRDSAWRNVSEGIERVVEELQRKRLELSS